ncbi:hypothetical protein [Bradyrhizobium sp. BWA-3-5]|uniref:hypothetical protein n=1 Tax=Bradyrhizobium sp. BWA-3-5 TaxID=3080013 RepID=UPI00293F1657|nr:hypothetical protein [Bradyrhizobium sp. BWA-3-5]WOH63275.1 hypothetical protein RX331_21330 [Bradyrhizobium sp. BWA-3-5]
MKRSIHICRLLAVFLIAGLVFAPLAARAKMDSPASVAAAAMADETSSMAEDMSCCSEKSAPADCADCPLMAICMVKTLQAQPSASIALVDPVMLRMLLPASDPDAESLGLSPPPKPPRSLVRPA